MKNSAFQTILQILTFSSVVLFVLSSVYAAGVLDSNFGTNGTVATNIGTSVRATATVIQPDGKIIVAGDAVQAFKREAAFARYNPNGTPDTSFGFGGKLNVSISNGSNFINAIALQPDGKIIAVGAIQSYGRLMFTFFLAIRLESNGALDPTFGNGGIVIVNQASLDTFNAVAIQPDGKIVAVGRTSDGDRAAVIRFNQNGSLDPTFGNSGLVYLSVQFLHNERLLAVALLPNGRILAGGIVELPSPPSWYYGTNFLVLLNPDGSPAQDFGNQGFVIFSTSEFTSEFDLAVLPNGTIVTVSDETRWFSSNGTIYTNLTRSSNGSDIAIRTDGKFVTTGPRARQGTTIHANTGAFIGRDKRLKSNDIAVQSDNKVVLINSTETEFVVTRLSSITSMATRLAIYDNRVEKTNLTFYRPGGSTIYVIYSNGERFNFSTNNEVRRIIPENYGGGFPYPLVSWLATHVGLGHFFGGIGPNHSDRFQWGLLGDIPTGGDFDGDTFTDFSVFRPSSGLWSINLRMAQRALNFHWGLDGDKPVPADYDYDGITDIAVYRPSTGTWWILRSSDGGYFSVRFGIASDIPLTGDFDGDGSADFTVYRASEGIWYQLLTTEGFRAVKFGLATDFPVPGDYDGDGRHDVAVFREGIWYLLQSTEGFKAVQWGQPGDVPVSVRYDQ